MTALPLLLVLSASADPVATYAAKACPAGDPGTSNVELKAAAHHRADCLERAMNTDLDRVLLPLKKQQAPAFRTWMDVQAGFNRWSKDVCDQTEELQWADWTTQLWSSGTAVGLAETMCRQVQFSERGYLARLAGTGAWKALQKHLSQRRMTGKKRREALFSLTQALARAAEKPAPASPHPDLQRPITAADWTRIRDRLERIRTEPDLLAAAQCALWPKYPGDCAGDLSNALLAGVEIPRL